MELLVIIATFLLLSFLLLFIALSILFLRTFWNKSLKNPNYPPVMGTIFHQALHFNRLYDQQAEVAEKHRTFRLLTPTQSQIYTTDTRNIEYVLKTNFANYSKGKYNQEIFTDLFGQGIFAVDGGAWRHQRKLASVEFSTRVLRDFSCAVFRNNAAKLAEKIKEFSDAGRVFDIQVTVMEIISILSLF